MSDDRGHHFPGPRGGLIRGKDCKRCCTAIGLEPIGVGRNILLLWLAILQVFRGHPTFTSGSYRSFWKAGGLYSLFHCWLHLGFPTNCGHSTMYIYIYIYIYMYSGYRWNILLLSIYLYNLICSIIACYVL